MQRYLLTICFDGTAYHGWQVQENAVSVQFTVQNALEKLLSYRPGLTGCSRTDSGVHANRYCCHFDADDEIPVIGIVRGMNAVLPTDIRALECRCVPDSFHARYSCVAKTYRYQIDQSQIQSPFYRNFAWHFPHSLDISAMNAFCSGLVGTHDFSAFSSSKRSVLDTVRTVRECFVRRDGNNFTLQITADGFLYNMVRIVVGTAVEVGIGRRKPEEAAEILEKKDRRLAGRTAPARGLYLNQIFYGEDIDGELP